MVFIWGGGRRGRRRGRGEKLPEVCPDFGDWFFGDEIKLYFCYLTELAGHWVVQEAFYLLQLAVMGI